MNAQYTTKRYQLGFEMDSNDAKLMDMFRCLAESALHEIKMLGLSSAKIKVVTEFTAPYDSNLHTDSQDKEKPK